MKRVIFTQIKLLMRKSRKEDVLFRMCQFTPCLIFSFFIRLFSRSIVPLFKCFPVPSYFRVPCSSVLTFRLKTKVFTPDRTPHCNCRYCNSRRHAASGIECGKGKSAEHQLYRQHATGRHGAYLVPERFWWLVCTDVAGCLHEKLG